MLINSGNVLHSEAKKLADAFSNVKHVRFQETIAFHVSGNPLLFTMSSAKLSTDETALFLLAV